MEKLIENIIPIYDFYSKEQDITIVYNFGKYSDNFKFDDTVINEDNFNKIKNKLDSCKTWDDISCEISDKPIKPINNYKNLIISFVNLPFDIKLSVNSFSEIEEHSNYIINQETIRYTKKNHSFILIKSKNNLNKYIYNVQLEVFLNPDINNNYMSESSLLKILDINKMIEPNEHNTIMINKIIE